MGFRHKLGILEKTKFDRIKDTTIEEYDKGHKAIYEITKEVYELGKYFNREFLDEFISPVYSNKEVHDSANDDNDFFLLSNEGIVRLIEYHRERVFNYYSSVKPEASDLFDEHDSYKQAIDKKVRQWGETCTKYKLYPYNLSLESECLVSAWDYEYQVFELVRIYKSIDWDNQLVTLNGW
jgi:hypothetical protein